MEQLTEAQFQMWILEHGGEAARAHNYRSVPAHYDEQRDEDVPASREVESTTIVAKDGAKITVRRTPESGQEGQADYVVESKAGPTAEKEPTPRTPEQTRVDAATAAGKELETEQQIQERNERQWNQRSGSGLPETHLERAQREAKEKEAQRLADERADAVRRSEADAQARRENDAAQRALTASEGAANRGLTQQQIDIQRQNAEREAKKPTFLSQADTKTPKITQYNPTTGQIESIDNPNYDAAKAAAEERRAELASQIASRQISLEEAKQQYTQWFDSNVKTPLMLAQEARAKAEEKRQALEAEERRRQFAADFRLRKATLGETAAQRATQAEISLLPYRAGPTEAAEMSAAINSLGRGGSLDADASAGINFTAEAFQFNKPDFKKIAKEATKAVLSGLTDYRPSDQEFAVGDYSSVPAVNTAGAPAYSYPSAAPLPEPSAEYAG